MQKGRVKTLRISVYGFSPKGMYAKVGCCERTFKDIKKDMKRLNLCISFFLGAN